MCTPLPHVGEGEAVIFSANTPATFYMLSFSLWEKVPVGRMRE
jgi:hypothetical protein